ncbi:MAG: DNA-3-methyladenine glycosylase I [Comamonas sp.]|jgi:DNA-3-methyladenine glycosylase I|uniref:DNA-3-methyladenine glycosylase I n=1 Tax=Comamonas sp. TaxID=34028 RepID=UPI0028185200|nr:DNA-3-methyladenine glycosylase I [Comamonas sp.]MDR0216363.1 DNA-3-methyladenine glycosylase I [Comamonas sp.]MDR2297883.1 DNA-3-methyladenine glycosylase I [Comamonas sp.]
MSHTLPSADGQDRCFWCHGTPAYVHYHDHEWGFPVSSDQRLFEKLCLEGFQSGLSWLTILNKRENFRAAFAGFDFHKVAQFGEADVERLLQDTGIVRHRGKIEAVINNARCALEMVDAEGSLAAFFWRYQPAVLSTGEVVPAQTAESQALSKELKKRGWKFVGPTTMYALMQAMGLVNDHAPGCITRAKVDEARAAFQQP